MPKLYKVRTQEIREYTVESDSAEDVIDKASAQVFKDGAMVSVTYTKVELVPTDIESE